jgi:glycosyltransferase involved in cell wall biosynthesis
MSPFLTVFIPAYNEESNLAHCVQAVLSKVNELGIAAEILIVNDGSRDGSAEVAEALATRFGQVRVIHHPQNRGMGWAFITAQAHAQGEWFILIPADLAIHPDDLQRYFEVAPQADIVVGLCTARSDYTPFRRLVSWANITLIRTLFGMKLRQFQYISLYRMDVLGAIRIEYWRSAFFLAEILIKARDQGRKLVEVEVRYLPRSRGRPSGARPGLIIRTVKDMFHFWLRWQWRRFFAMLSPFTHPG